MLTPYLLNLLDWLQDLTWPGSIIILERLKKYSDYRALNMAIENRVKVASALEDTNWISNISELLICHTVKESLDEEVLTIISKNL